MPAVITGTAVNNASVLWSNKLSRTSIINPTDGNRVNLTDPATWSLFTPSASGPIVSYDLGQSEEIDSLGIAAHNLASSGASFTFQYSTDNTTWNNARPSYSPLTDDDLFFIFPAQTARYWRINFVGSGFTVGVAFGGKRLDLQHAPIDGYTPIHHARKYTKLFNDSIKGQFLGNRVMSAGAETRVDMGFFDRSWMEGNIRGFESHYNQGGTFFYAGCPSKYPLDIGYCRAGGDDDTLEIEWTEAEKMATLSFSIRSYVG